MTTDRDKARELLRGWQAGINGAQCGPAAAAPIAAVAYALLDLGDTIRVARMEGVARHDREPADAADARRPVRADHPRVRPRADHTVLRPGRGDPVREQEVGDGGGIYAELERVTVGEGR